MTIIELKDPETWQKSMENNPREDDGGHNYGSVVNDFAEKWAVLMQEAMNEDGSMRGEETFGEVAKRTEREADTALGKWSGITGFQFGCAMSLLSHCWKHGEQLRRWHNLNTQIGDEGEKANESGAVLNPAIISIGRASE